MIPVELRNLHNLSFARQLTYAKSAEAGVANTLLRILAALFQPKYKQAAPFSTDCLSLLGWGACAPD